MGRSYVHKTLMMPVLLCHPAHPCNCDRARSCTLRCPVCNSYLRPSLSLHLEILGRQRPALQRLVMCRALRGAAGVTFAHNAASVPGYAASTRARLVCALWSVYLHLAERIAATATPGRSSPHPSSVQYCFFYVLPLLPKGAHASSISLLF